MEEMIETSAAPAKVWAAWERGLERGKEGNLRYKVIEIRKGEGFSILWKTLFVRLIFSHSVKPTKRGSEIQYKVQIKGFFAPLVRLFLGAKIKKNLSHVLKSIVRELEA